MVWGATAGIALWAGRNFDKKARLEHKEVKQVRARV